MRRYSIGIDSKLASVFCVIENKFVVGHVALPLLYCSGGWLQCNLKAHCVGTVFSLSLQTLWELTITFNKLLVWLVGCPESRTSKRVWRPNHYIYIISNKLDNYNLNTILSGSNIITKLRKAFTKVKIFLSNKFSLYKLFPR